MKGTQPRRRGARRLERLFNDISVRKKLRYLYYFCILVPIVLTDAVILMSLIRAEGAERRREMADVASAVQYSLSNFVEGPSVIAKTIYLDSSLQDFLEREYASPEEYYTSYQHIRNVSVLKGISGIDNTVITVYTDNETLVNGGGFLKVSEVEREDWYRRWLKSPHDTQFLIFGMEDDTRRLCLLRNLNRHSDDKDHMFVMIEMNYRSLVRNITSMKYPYPVHICWGDWTVICSDGPNNVQELFTVFDRQDEVGLEETFDLYGETISVRVLQGTNNVVAALRDNAGLFLLLIVFNIITPQFLMNLLERSITGRLFRLGDVFNQVDSGELVPIEGETGRDEIGALMNHYNRMAVRMNDLIDQVYRNRLREQEMDIARQNAELLALQSQINPHFLFNALESIRMHSILKSELETADMVEKLAIMERQNVDWSSDTNTVRRELEFVEAYLGLQKYRFGERLNYRVEAEKECEGILVPKLTVTTFVENACVHGIESKTSPGWIFVRVGLEDGFLCVEVEDTGGGMEEDEARTLEERMRGASIDMLKGKGRVGVVNACLRIRMMTDDTAEFSVESEKGIGTLFAIRIPLEKTERTE